MFCRGSDQGGGVGGINYAEYSDGSELNYKIYNLRGNVIKTVDANKQTKSFSNYYAFGEYKDVIGDIKTDDYRANTKVEDDHNLLNEGKRFRQLEYGIFLTPDPLEYVDGYNPYIYCGQNPWGKWDPEGLAFLGYDSMGEYFKEVGKFYSGYGLAVKDTVVGAYDMVRHPVDTAKGIAHAVTNPVSTAKAVANNISETWNSGSEGQGRIVGNALIAFATSGASATKVGNLTNIAGKGVKSASALVKGETESAAKVANIVGVIDRANKDGTVGELASIVSKDRVNTVLEMLEKSGANIKVNSKTFMQEGNVTLDFANKGRVNIRVETHPLTRGGPPVRHANVEDVSIVNGKNYK